VSTNEAGEVELATLKGEFCAVLHPEFSGDSSEMRSAGAKLDEAVGLAIAIDLEIAHSEVVRMSGRPKPGTFFGKGTVERIAGIVGPQGAVRESGIPDHESSSQDTDQPDTAVRRAHLRGHKRREPNAISLVIVNTSLSPVQQRNLERAWKAKVIDRTGLILEIFGDRARTKEGRLQVELAALTYQRSRLVRSWTHLERQRGGLGFVGGPGETQIETDRRLIDERIVQIKRQLASVERTRRLHRSARKRVPYPSVALVGYTNAGKSTLFNRMTAASVETKDQLFATLDPTMRRITLPSGTAAILSDTVGFVSDLPHELVKAFHATLEEVHEADMILHVRDIAHADSEAQKKDVLGVLKEIGVLASNTGERPVDNDDEMIIIPFLEVINKIDLLSDEQLNAEGNRVARTDEPKLMVSAITGEGVEDLGRRIDQELTRHHRLMSVVMGYEDGASIAWVYAHGNVVERRDESDGVHIRVRMSPHDAERLKERQGVHFA